jgi:uncharacterized tellurite resistance protein B-like protein
MVVSLETKVALQVEFRQLLQKYQIPEQEIDHLVTKLWPDIAEALDFTEFTESLEDTSQSTTVIDPLAHLDESERESHLKERINQMDAETRQMLERTQGKWVHDEHQR